MKGRLVYKYLQGKGSVLRAFGLPLTSLPVASLESPASRRRRTRSGWSSPSCSPSSWSSSSSSGSLSSASTRRRPRLPGWTGRLTQVKSWPAERSGAGVVFYILIWFRTSIGQTIESNICVAINGCKFVQVWQQDKPHDQVSQIHCRIVFLN